MFKMNRKKRNKGVEWRSAPKIKRKVKSLLRNLELDWIDQRKITCFSSTGSSTRAYARIWGLSKIWQMALKNDPHYIIEVISERFNKLSEKEKDEVLIHELMHIPKNFSGALMPHIRKSGKRNFHDKVKVYVNKLRSI